MIVHRLAVCEWDLLRELAAFLDAVAPPPPPWDARGDWRADIEAGPPAVDRPQPLAYRRQFMQAPVRVGSMSSDVIVSALNYYPEGGAGIGWHTDTGHPGWRIYLARPLSHVPGSFLVPNGAYIDSPGIATAFEVTGNPCESWHAVSSEGPRLSIGIRFKGGPTARALGLV